MLVKAGVHFLLAAVVGGIVVGIVGMVMERGFLQYLHGKLNEQVLLTFGFVYIITNSCYWIWGTDPAILTAPMAGSINVGKFLFPIYPLVLILVGLVMAFGLYLFQEKTRIGAMIRAGMDNPEMTMGLGINLGFVCSGVFGLGAFVAGFAGILGAPIFGVYPRAAVDTLILALIVVVVGGTGSIQGALMASLILGLLISFTGAYFPLLSSFVMYLVLIIILIFKPSGILGRRT
jgi:branched-chain amino acid transport system permease protein